MTIDNSALFSVTIQKGRLSEALQDQVASLKTGEIVSLSKEEAQTVPDLSRTMHPNFNLLTIMDKSGKHDALAILSIKEARKYVLSHPGEIHVYKVTQGADVLFEISSADNNGDNNLTRMFGTSATFQAAKDPTTGLTLCSRTFLVPPEALIT